ncbi:glycosyltransferase family 4 protein [candidate division KSB1 bacterium]|nr:glycosyltransferase family 4 protein [candidate division KSB1 bacterium]
MTFCFAMDFHYTERIGGAEVQAWLLAKELARRGFEVHYLAQSLRGKAEVTEARDGVHLHWVRNPGHLQWRNGLRYYRALKRINPDLLIQRTTSFNTGVIGFYARKHRKQFAWICTDNDIPARWFFARKEIRTIPAKNLLRKLKSPLLLVNAIVHDLARDWGMKQTSHVFTQNDEQFCKLISNYKLPSLRMPSGHELPEMGISPQQRFRNKTILWVGNLGANKRPEKFLQLAKMMRRHEWKFVMVGGKEGVNSFEDFFGESRLDNLRWLGKLSFNETLLSFDQATIFVNTSKTDGEGFPNTYIQAWLRGIPVVTLGVDPNQHIKKK